MPNRILKDSICTSETTFDSGDVSYLCRFAVPWLRSQMKATRERLRLETETRWKIFYKDLIKVYEEAIATLVKHTPQAPSTGAGSTKRVSADDVKQKYDVVDYIGQYTRLRKAGNNFTGICPLHSEKRPSLMIYPDKQSWHCYGACNTGGSVIDFVMKYENLDFKGALERLK